MGDTNSDIVKPTINGSDITGRGRNEWTIDFGDLDQRDAALYEAPFEYVKIYVKPVRERNRDRQRRESWWRLGRSGGDLRNAKKGKRRIVLTPRVAKYRLFVWADSALLQTLGCMPLLGTMTISSGCSIRVHTNSGR